MEYKHTRLSLLAAAVAAALSLAACGDASNDTATTTSRVDPPVTSPARTADQMTADASKAADRAANTVEKAGSNAASAVGDAAVTAKVKSRLMAEPGIDSLQIDVDTNNGRVTLTGEVDTPQHKARAKELAGAVEGVTGVVDRLAMKSK